MSNFCLKSEEEVATRIDLEQLYQACCARQESVEHVLKSLKFHLPSNFEQVRLKSGNANLVEISCACPEDEVAKFVVKRLRADNRAMWIISWKKSRFAGERIFRFTRKVAC